MTLHLVSGVGWVELESPASGEGFSEVRVDLMNCCCLMTQDICCEQDRHTICLRVLQQVSALVSKMYP